LRLRRIAVRLLKDCDDFGAVAEHNKSHANPWFFGHLSNLGIITLFSHRGKCFHDVDFDAYIALKSNARLNWAATNKNKIIKMLVF
jgi:hypothetical protein